MSGDASTLNPDEEAAFAAGFNDDTTATPTETPAEQQDNATQQEEGSKGPAGRRFAERKHSAGAQGDGDRRAGVDDAHDRRPMVAPDGQRYRFLDLLAKILQDRTGDAYRIEAPEARKAEVEGVAAQVVTSAGAVLLDQSDAHEADHVAVCLGGRHAGAFGNVAQHHRAIGGGQRAQKTKPHFDRLNSLSFVGNFGDHGMLAR